MTQTQWVVQRLHQQWPDLEIHIEQIHTTGDRVTDLPLAKIGGDGVFVTEIEKALHERRIDLAVHSLKDLPTVQPDDLTIAVVGPREDVRDAFISTHGLRIADHRLVIDQEQLDPRKIRIGTSSLRRAAQMRAFCPEADILSIRGNVDTRLRKLEAGDYDAIVLAAAGLHRLGLHEHLTERLSYFPVDMMMPAPGQGALALECRAEASMLALLEPLRDHALQAATAAERMFMRHLGAGCYLPVAAYGEVVEQRLTLQGLVASMDGREQFRVQHELPWTESATLQDAEQLGVTVAEKAMAQGADKVIQALTVVKEQEQLNV